MDHDFASVHYNAKNELKQYPAILTSRLVNNTYMVSGNQKSLLAHIYQAAIITGIVI